MGVFRVEAGAAPGPALAHQVPALVELRLELAQAGGVVARQAVALGRVLETVLLLDQLVDPADEVLVVHAPMLTRPAAANHRRPSAHVGLAVCGGRASRERHV